MDKIMENFEMTDKRKLELIELIMSNDYEKVIGKEFCATEAALTKERKNTKHLSRVCCELAIMLMVFMILCYIFLINR
jgi:hypothetical protein